MPALTQHTNELYENWNPQIAAELLGKVSDSTNTYAAASIFGNNNPRPAKIAGYDRSLTGGSTQAYYVDPWEVKQYYPAEGEKMVKKIGPDPLIALNPDLVKIYQKNPGFVDAVIAHEHTHGGQQGKMALKQVYARTPLGNMPLGLWLIEGGVEWALERRGKKPPTRYFDERSGGKKSAYSHYRDFVHELEAAKPGIMRQVYRAAEKAGPANAIRLLETVPGIHGLVEKYTKKLYTMQSGTAAYQNYNVRSGTAVYHRQLPVLPNPTLRPYGKMMPAGGTNVLKPLPQIRQTMAYRLN